MQTRKKSARRGLLVSATSLLLSVAMLVGTTFAWFTDSVSSGTNTIKAGNLDIELTHSNAYVTTDESVTENVKLFVDKDGQTADWEPGVVAYENFTIKNAGSLALSFRFSLKSLVAGVGYNFVAEPTENGGYTATDRSLLDVIKVAVINNGTFSGDREVAKGLTYLGTLKEFVTNNEAVISGSNMMPGATQYFAVVLYWPSDTEPASALNGSTLNDNSYNIQNGKKTSISSTVYEEDNENPALYVNLGIDLKATQYTYENDSFGNDYDESQVQATVVASSAVVEATANQATVFTNPVAPEGNSSGNQTKVTFSPNALPVGTYTQTTQTTDLIGTTGFEVTASETLVPATVEGVTPGQPSQQVVANIDLSIVDSTGTKVFTTSSSGTATVETYIAKNLTGVCVAYRGEGVQPEITNVTYYPQTGKLSFTTNHFSEYYATGDGVAYVREKGTVYGTLEDAIAEADDGNTVVVLKDVAISNGITLSKGVTLDGNGNTVTAQNLNPAINVSTDSQVTIQNIKVTEAKRGLNLNTGAPHLTLTNTDMYVNERGISFMYTGVTLDANIILDNTKINMLGVSNYDTDAKYSTEYRGISIFDVQNSSITLRNGSEINGFSYCINVSGTPSSCGVADTTGLVVTVQDSTLRGWAGFNVWGAFATYNLTGSTVLGVNTSNGGSNSFSAIVFNDDIYNQVEGLHAENNILNLTNCTIKNYQDGECLEQLLRIDSGITKLNLYGTVNFVDTTGNIESALYLSNMEKPTDFLRNNVNSSGATINCTSTVQGKSLAFAPTINTYYYWDDGNGGYEGCYANLPNIFDGVVYTLCSGEYIDLVDNVVLQENKTATLYEGAGNFTLRLNGYTITGGKIVLPAGVGVITDTPQDLENGIFAAVEGATLTETQSTEGTTTIYTYTSVADESN